MITCSRLLRRYWRWFFVFLICFLIQVLLIILFYEIEETTEFKNLIKFSRTRSNPFIYPPSYEDGQPDDSPNQTVQSKAIGESSDEFDQTSNSKEFNEQLSNCDTDDPYLRSAVERARSQLCKLQIKRVFCRHQTNQLYSEKLVNRCPIKSIFRQVGCYLNNRRPSAIESLVFRYKKANELRCSFLCTQLNTRYFGIENATLCHCIKESPSEQLRIDSSLCNVFCDYKSQSYRCGGEYLISVYETGIYVDEENHEQQTTSQLTKDRLIRKPIKIAFLFSVNGRSIRQIKRLIKQLYDRRHIYFVHVDKQNDFLYNALRDELSELNSNLMVTNQRFYTIWGGSQLLEMLLNSFQLLLQTEWDYVINLSESDYPIKSLSSLESYLEQFRGRNFLKFHGQNNDAFVRKQGLEVLFLQCENKMWRLNKQRDLIKEISFSGGSDWFALHRTLVNFIVNRSNQTESDHHFLSTLKRFFNHTLLPAESFFHTVLQNSAFCTKLINNNLRITNWKRKIGCKCQYKHIVDWCGCSPNVYREADWPKLKATLNKPLFFARKFDPLINQAIINQVESTYLNSSTTGLINLNKYWHNEYHFKYDKSSSIQSTYTLLSAIALRELFSNCSNYYELITLNTNSLLDTIGLSNVNTYINRDEYVGTAISFNFTHADRFKLTHLKLDALVSPNHYFKPYDLGKKAPKLISLKVGLIISASAFVNHT